MSEIIDFQHVRTEKSVRNFAHTLGYHVTKSRARISGDNYGEYMLVDDSTNGVVIGARYDATLQDIWNWLCWWEEQAATA